MSGSRPLFEMVDRYANEHNAYVTSDEYMKRVEDATKGHLSQIGRIARKYKANEEISEENRQRIRHLQEEIHKLREELNHLKRLKSTLGGRRKRTHHKTKRSNHIKRTRKH